MAFFLAVALLFFCGLSRASAAPALAADARQMIVCLAPKASSSEGTLQLFSRDKSGRWLADSASWAVLFGRGGLAWGRGLHPDQPGPQKQTNDRRNPAGLFKIGQVLGYAARLPPGSHGWPYHQVTARDAWIDDASLGLPYNHLYTLPSSAPYPVWWEKEKLHLDDAAYQWLVLIGHNYENPVPEAGNEIFFHVRRGEHYRTAGCTTMALADIERLIAWLQPGSNAMMVELTRADYARFWKPWGLPPPAPEAARP